MLVRIGAFRRGRDRDEERHPRLERSKRRADPTELPLGAETASAADYDRSNVPEKLETQVDHLAAVLIDLNMPCGPGGYERTQSEHRGPLTKGCLRMTW